MSLVLQNQPLPMKTDEEGVVRLGGTRVTLDSVLAEFKTGATAEQIAHDYPVLDLADIYAAIAFYLARREEVEEYLAEQRKEGQRLRDEMNSRFDPLGIRDRLLARRAKREQQDASISGG
jgi:uncharacterized protein (DUF433 family)